MTLDFLRTETGAGAILAVAALLGITAANSAAASDYQAWLGHPWTVQLGVWSHTLSSLDWIKEGLMTVFFFVVGLEIKFETVRGELSSPRRLALPVAAALGGMIAPALIYVLVNRLLPGGAPGGWPTPVATDIAFALAALSVFGRSAPPALRTFLLALAVADDLGAVVLIGVLFTHHVDLGALATAGAALGVLALLGRWRTAPLPLYVATAAVLWAATLDSGVSPSVAGVAAAMTIPLEPRRMGERGFLERASDTLHPYAAYLILPLFAFAAAGFSLRGLTAAQVLGPVPLGIAAGLVVGKPLGVMGACAAAERLGLAHRPSGAGWSELFAVSLLCGVGFTMSLYLAGLAFPHAGAAAQAGARLGIVGASLCATALGGAMLTFQARRRRLATQDGG